MDAPPPNLPDPPPYVYAASDSRPRQAREIELCSQASTTDWLYLSGLGAGLVGSITLDTLVFRPTGAQKEKEDYNVWRARIEGDMSLPAARTFGSGLVGLSVGALVGGFYLTLPKCDPHFAYGPPPEGSMRSTWPTALTLGLVSAVVAPLVVAIESASPYGYISQWEVSERAIHFVVPAVTGFVGAFLPYLLPPRTWRAAREIERIRGGVTSGGAFVGYSFTF